MSEFFTIAQVRGEYDILNEKYISGKIPWVTFRDELYSLADSVKRSKYFSDEEKTLLLQYMDAE